MSLISVMAEAGLDIVRRITAGELEVHGIILRDANTKKFRYILRGFEDLPADVPSLGDLPPLEPLRAALNLTQILQIVSVAQNVAIAASLRRVEARLTAIEDRLSNIESRLKRVEATQQRALSALRTQPVSRLKAAQAAAAVALHHRDRTALIVAGKDAQQAFHDLLALALDLVRVEQDGVPVGLRLPNELADLCESAADAAYIASAIWIALDTQDAAMRVTRECAAEIQSIRRKMASVLTDPELLLRRMSVDEGGDDALQAAAQRLKSAMHRALGRSVMIEQGLVTADLDYLSFDRVAPAGELSFLPIVDVAGEMSG